MRPELQWNNIPHIELYLFVRIMTSLQIRQ